MAQVRWWRLLTCLVMAVMWWGCPAAVAQQGPEDTCRTGRLGKSVADARIRFDQHGRDYVEVHSYMTVRVPVKEWPLARHLTFKNNSSAYLTAMRCLLRGKGDDKLDEEWRPYDPLVTSHKDWVTVQYDAFAWINQYKPFRLGPWRIHHTGGRRWQVDLQPPTLRNNFWHTVKAELGGLEFADLSERATSAGANTLEWDGQPPQHVRIEVDLPWQRFFLLGYAQSFWSSLSVASWWVCASFVIAVAALRAQRPSPDAVPGPGAPAGTPGGMLGENLAQTVLQWALLSVAVALALNLNTSWLPVATRWRTLACIAAGAALVLAARPWSGDSPVTGPEAEPGGAIGPRGAQRRQTRAVVATTGAVAAAGTLVVLAPGLFGLPPGLATKTMPSAPAATGLALMGLSALWLWLAAMAAWAWRFAREGGLVSETWTARWDSRPGRCTAAVTALLVVVAAALLGCFCWTQDRQWKRVTWLADRDVAVTHGSVVSNTLANAYFTDLLWLFARSWVLTCVALVSLLHFRVRAQRAQLAHLRKPPPVGPERPDLLLTVTIFSFIVGLRGTKIAGVIGAQYAIWFLLSVFSLYLVLAVGRRWAVLGQLGDRFCAQRLGTRRRRQELLKKSHQYRNLNRQLYLLDQGRANDVPREELEARLHKLRQWLVAGCATRNPPQQISVLDVTLAWGPEDHWWSNALCAARLAFWFGIPATVALLCLDLKGSWDRTRLFFEPTGFPDVVAESVLYQMAWVGAGFVLGALWRLLPGRRSLARAGSLTIAYAIPVLMAFLLDLVTDADAGYILLYVLVLLTILTLTSMWMDMTTFREERQFLPSRFTLLLSIYQLRGFSGQMAWILAQVATAVTIWHQLANR
ncbi:DUF6185 family protein [Streptomyces bungoensis]|uniref:DUF6185 family protein n=1 Tax=Streptomyces bungoensis TaxID=285568 RepID=UPI00343F4575